MEIGNTKLLEGRHRRLGYAQEFRQMVHEHPGILRTTLELTQKAEDAYNPPNITLQAFEYQWNKERVEFEAIKILGEALPEPTSYGQIIGGRGIILVPGETLRDEGSGLEVTVLGRSNREFWTLYPPQEITRVDKSTYIKAKLGKSEFFVKKSTHSTNPGFEEFKNTIMVKETLAGIENLQVTEAQLGYTDDHESWFVSKWEDLESTGFFPYNAFLYNNSNDYGKFTPGETLMDKKPMRIKVTEKAQVVIHEVKTRLSKIGMQIGDFRSNLLYNPETDKFFLLDITTDHDKTLGQPDLTL